MAETSADQPRSISLEGTLGFEARMAGRHAFGQLTGALTDRLNHEPKFADVLQQFIGYANSEKTRVHELRFNGKSDPKLLSEELLGKWVVLAAEHTLLDAKTMPNESDGARWIQLEGEVARLEDAILLAHRGEKSVTLDERFIKIIADPTGDTQQRIADSLDGVAKTLSTGAARATLKVLPVVVAGEMLFSACSPIKPSITPEATRPVVTQPATLAPTLAPEIPSATPSGPEATPIAASSYPSSVSVEQITNARTLITDAPSTITSDPEVQAIINKHKELAQQAGLTFDHMEAEYVVSISRWYIYPADSQGNIVGWLQIEDPTSQTGWRYAEQPTWDSQFHPSQDKFQFGLPDLRDPQDHFEMVVINGFPILVEVTPDGKPQYWNNITMKQIMAVDGAEIQGPKPIVMLSDMTLEGGPAQCSQNVLDLDSPSFDKQVQDMMASIRLQDAGWEPRVLLRVQDRPGSTSDLYPHASFYFSSLEENPKVPIVACGEIDLGGATGRIQFLDRFPFPTVDGGTEPITIGLVSEPEALKKIVPLDLYNNAIDDNVVFRGIQPGTKQISMELYIYPYFNAPPGDQAGYQQFIQNSIDTSGATITPKLMNDLEAQHYSQYFIEVFYNHDFTHLAELKELMQDHLLPGWAVSSF